MITYTKQLEDALESLLSLGKSESFGDWEAWEEVKTAREVLASKPASNALKALLDYQPASHRLASNASCLTRQ